MDRIKNILRKTEVPTDRYYPHNLLGSDITRKLVYTSRDVNNDNIGLPGSPPFTRGIHRDMYRGRTFTMRQLSGAGSPSQVNQRLKILIERGATGINLILDLATIQMYDSDEPEALGQVGTVGVPIDCVEDMETIYKDIPITKVSSSIVTHYPQNTAILFPMYLVMAERRGVDWAELTGSVQNDFVMESVVRSALDYLPPKDDFRIQCDNIEFIRRHVPQWNCATFNGYNLRDWGTSSITEAAVALSNGILTIKEMMRRGYPADFAAKRIAFFWDIASDFFEEIARLRAVRRLWYKIMKYVFNVQDERAMWMRCHVQTSGLSLQREEPLNNIVRSSYQALAAVLGGAQSMHVDAYDEAYSVPSEETSVLSLRTQQIIDVETQVTKVVDPLGGSYYVEQLTDEIEQRIIEELDEIERAGGLLSVVTTGVLHQQVVDNIEVEQEMIETGAIQIVGRNYFRDPYLMLPDIRVNKYDSGIAEAMVNKLTRVRASRSEATVRVALDNLTSTCINGGNVMDACLLCARADVTKGEMRRAFTKAFGSWKSPLLS